MNGGTNQENKPRDDELGISPPLFDDTPIDLSSQTLTSCSWSHLSNNNIAAEKSLANTSDFMINRSALPEEDPFISFTSCSSFVSSTPKKASEKTGQSVVPFTPNHQRKGDSSYSQNQPALIS